MQNTTESGTSLHLGAALVNTPKPILCVGALTADLMLQVPDLPAVAGKYLAKRAVLVAAGMAASAATAVARLGYPVTLWASAGDDMIGDFVVAEIARDGIDTRYIRRMTGVMSATATILVDDRGERVVVPYYATELMATPTDIPAFDALSGVLVDVRWPNAAAIALDGAVDAGIPAILDLDVGAKSDLLDLAARATHIVASLEGARILAEAENASEAVDVLASLTDALIVVTDGAKGAYWRAAGKEQTHHVPAFPVNAVDTNAAGDVFHGAFAAGIAQGMGLEETVRFASAAAAIKCTRYGGRTGAPTLIEVESFLAERRQAA